MAGPFNLDTQSSLMLGTDSAAGLGNYLCPVRQIFAQLLPIFVIGVSVFFAERAIGGHRAKSGTRGFSLFFLFHALAYFRRESLLHFLLSWRISLPFSWTLPPWALPSRREQLESLGLALRACRMFLRELQRLSLNPELSCR